MDSIYNMRGKCIMFSCTQKREGAVIQIVGVRLLKRQVKNVYNIFRLLSL